jgi:acyl-CoA reductase-like NAD-dependent aldehyde dehydrogenase
MLKTAAKLKHDGREVDAELEALADDLDKSHALDALSVSEGGKILTEALITNVIDTIEVLSASYEKASHMELVSHCASLRFNLALLRSIKRAKKNKLALKEMLAEALQE